MPGGLTLLASLNADIPTPAASKVTIYFSIDLGSPAYKDDAGVVHTLIGPAGSAGPQGPAGIADQGDEPDIILALPGPQGNPGTTGSQGPTGPMFIGADGEDGNDGIGVPGPTGPAGSAGSSALLSVTVALTDAEFRALNTVSKAVLAAPGAGITILPLMYSFQADVTSNFSNGPTWTLRYVGGASSQIVGIAMSTNSSARRQSNSAQIIGVNRSLAGVENTGVEITSNAASVGGSTSGGFSFTLWYFLVTTP